MYLYILKQNKMIVTTPKDMSTETIMLVEPVITKFENEFSKKEKGASHYKLVILGECPAYVRREIKERYIDAGWIAARCRSSYEESGAIITSLELCTHIIPSWNIPSWDDIGINTSNHTDDHKEKKTNKFVDRIHKLLRYFH